MREAVQLKSKGKSARIFSSPSNFSSLFMSFFCFPHKQCRAMGEEDEDELEILLRQRGIPFNEQSLVLQCLKKNKIFSLLQLFNLFVEGGGLLKLKSWGVAEAYAKNLEKFWKDQPVNADFLTELHIPQAHQHYIQTALNKDFIGLLRANF